MKFKKFLAGALSVAMISSVSVPVFAGTYTINEFTENYVLCEESFTGAVISDSSVTIGGTTQLSDGDIKLYNGGTVIADVAEINEGIVDVSFGFTPQMENAGSGTAVQSFIFGTEENSVELKASWVRGTSNTMTDGKFMVGSTELVKFNGGTGEFRFMLSNTSTGYVTYDINAKINLTTNKITFKIDETVITPDSNTTDTVYTGEFDYTADSFELFKAVLSTPSGLISRIDFVDVKLDGVASYAAEEKVMETKVIYNETFPAGSTAESATVQNWQVYDATAEGYRRVKSGITGSISADIKDVKDEKVTLTYGVKPYMTGGTGSELVVMHIGPDSSTGIDISMYNAANGTNTMPSAWYIGKSTASGEKLFDQNSRYTNDMESTPHISKYDVTVDVDLKAKKAYLSIYMNAQTTAGDASCYKVQSKEIPYNFDSVGYLEIYNTEHNGSVVSAYIYPIKVVNSPVFAEDSVDIYNETFPANSTSEAITTQNWQVYDTASEGVRRIRSEISGIITADIRDTVSRKNTITYGLKPSMTGGTASELVVMHIGPDEETGIDISMYNAANGTNTMPTAWYIGKSTADGALLFEQNCRYVNDSSTTPYISKYDVTVDVDLDAKKAYLSIYMNAQTTAGDASCYKVQSKEIPYNFDSLGYLKVYNTELSGTAVMAYIYPIKVVNSAIFDVSENVSVLDNGVEITTLQDFKAADKPVVNLKFKNTTGNDMSVSVIIAYYKGDALVQVDDVKNITIDGTYEKVDCSYNFEKLDVDADSIKVFAWENLTTLVPLKDSAEIQ